MEARTRSSGVLDEDDDEEDGDEDLDLFNNVPDEPEEIEHGAFLQSHSDDPRC